jgi:hypothetical protein
MAYKDIKWIELAQDCVIVVEILLVLMQFGVYCKIFVC